MIDTLHDNVRNQFYNIFPCDPTVEIQSSLNKDIAVYVHTLDKRMYNSHGDDDEVTTAHQVSGR